MINKDAFIKGFYFNETSSYYILMYHIFTIYDLNFIEKIEGYF